VAVEREAPARGFRSEALGKYRLLAILRTQIDLPASSPAWHRVSKPMNRILRAASRQTFIGESPAIWHPC